MTDFNPRKDIEVSYNIHPVRQTISPNGISYKGGTTITVRNKSDHDVSWINIEYICINPAKYSSDRCMREFTLKKETIYQLQGNEEKSFNYDYIQTNFKTYKIYGELTLGQKFLDQRYKVLNFGQFDTCEDSYGCFVTTAAYGDGDHPMVQEFRGFRDQVLAGTKSGRAFIDWYYENGPQMAAVLNEKPALKAPVRTILTPLAFTARAFRKMNGRELSKR